MCLARLDCTSPRRSLYLRLGLDRIAKAGVWLVTVVLHPLGEGVTDTHNAQPRQAPRKFADMCNTQRCEHPFFLGIGLRTTRGASERELPPFSFSFFSHGLSRVTLACTVPIVASLIPFIASILGLLVDALQTRPWTRSLTL